jgi:2'-5' RNA ligase
MAAIAQALDARLSKEFRVEARGFSPHLTIARSDPPLRLPPDFVDTVVEPVAFQVERLTLFRSHLQRPAPRYEPLEVMPLGVGPLRGSAPTR